MTRIVILTEKSGDLCNRLFRFARFYCSKPKDVLLLDITLYQFAYLFSPRCVFWRVFLLALRLLNNARFARVAKILEGLPGVETILPPGPDANGGNTEISQIYSQMRQSSRRIFVVKGGAFYMRGEEGNDRAMAELRRIFSLKPRYKNAVKKLLGKDRREAPVVGVHLRRRDYRTFAGGKFYFDDEEYHNRLLGLASGPSGNNPPLFVLICEEPLDIANFSLENVRCLGPSSIGFDQALLEVCDYIVGPPSTFNAWPSLLHGIPRAVISRNKKCLDWTDFSPASVNYTPI